MDVTMATLRLAVSFPRLSFYDSNAVIFCIVLIFLGPLATAAAASTSSSSSTLNNNIRSLDSYGHAVQLQHAQAAATLQGRTLLILQRTKQRSAQGSGESSSSTWIVYRLPTASAHHRRSHQRRMQDDDSILHIVGPSSSKTSSDSPPAAVVCSGVQADALALVDVLQQYLVGLWERYDSTSTGGLAPVVAQLCRRFWNYPSNNDDDDGPQLWQGTCGSRLLSSSNSNDWARPMGIQTLILNDGKLLQVIQPSGAIQSFPKNVAWMGGRSEELNYHHHHRATRQSSTASKSKSSWLMDDLEQLLVDDSDSEESYYYTTDAELQSRLETILSKHAEAVQTAFGMSTSDDINESAGLVVERFDVVAGRFIRRPLQLQNKLSSIDDERTKPNIAQ
jgi:hypothetical protein